MTGVRARTLGLAVGAVLVAQALTMFAVHRMVAHPPAPRSRQAAEPPRQAPDVPALAAAGRFRPPSPAAVNPQGGPSGEPPRIEAPVSRVVVQPASAGPPLDASTTSLADEVGQPPDGLRPLADDRGRVTDAAKRDLLAGREAAANIARDLDLTGDGEERLTRIVVGFMVRRVAMREAFKGSAVTAAAIDDAVRSDALSTTEGNLGAEARAAVASTLPTLPDLTADLPSAPR